MEVLCSSINQWCVSEYSFFLYSCLLLLICFDFTISEAPPVSGFVRCDLVFNVRVMKDVGNGVIKFAYMNLVRIFFDEDLTELLQTDMKGLLPKFLVNSSNASISMKEIDLIRKVCQKDTAKQKEFMDLARV